MYGADDLWPRKQLLIRPGKIYLDFLPPVMPLDSTDENIQIQKEIVYNLMLETYLKRVNKE
jgi:hypothetical protein